MTATLCPPPPRHRPTSSRPPGPSWQAMPAALRYVRAVRTVEVPSHPNRGPVAPVGDDVRHPGRSLHVKRLGILQPDADRRALSALSSSRAKSRLIARPASRAATPTDAELAHLCPWELLSSARRQ